MPRIRIVVCIAGLALTVAACASRPTENELAEAIVAAAETNEAVQVTPEQALCMASQLLASDLSDTTLAGLAEDFDTPQVLQTEADEVEDLVPQAFELCPVTPAGG